MSAAQRWARHPKLVVADEQISHSDSLPLLFEVLQGTVLLSDKALCAVCHHRSFKRGCCG
jgi:hypothetical protein